MKVTVDESSAWIVVGGAFLMQFIIIGYLKSTGILMREFQAYFNCSNTLILLVTSLTLSLMNILAPAYSLLSRRIQLRWMVLTSGLIICLSMCLLYVRFSLPLWVACIGLCTGICLSACYSSVICKVNECFDRRRDFANGICFSGSSAGAVAMPLLFTYLADRYSVAGCCLLIGGYFLHLVIVGALMPTGVQSGQQLPVTRPRLASEAAFSSFGSQFGSRMGEMAGCPPQQQQPQESGTRTGRLASLSTSQRWLTLIYMLATMLSNLGFTTQYVVFPMFLAEFSVSNAATAVLVALHGLCDLAARILTGWLSDRYRWRKASVAITGMTTMGIVCVLVALCASHLPAVGHGRLILFVTYAVMAGASGGVYMSIVTSVLVCFVGVANLSFIHSIICCSWTVATFPGQTLLGYLKDRTGTFKYSFALAGLCMICASIILLFERLVKRDVEEQLMNDKTSGAERGEHAIRDGLLAKNGAKTGKV